MALQPHLLRAMLQCFALGSIAALLVVLNTAAQAVLPEVWAAVLLIFAAMLYPRLPVACGVTSFLVFGAIALPAELAFNIFRVAAFVLAVQVSRQLFAPVAIVTVSWLLTLALSVFMPAAFPYQAGVATANSLAIEIFCSALLWFFLCAPAIGRSFRLSHLTLQQFFVHMLILPFFAFVFMVSGLAYLHSDHSVLRLVKTFRLVEPAILFGALSLLLAGILLAAVLAHLLLDIVEQYERAALEAKKRPWNLPFLDAAVVLERIFKQTQEYHGLKQMTDVMLSGSAIEIDELANVWQALRKGTQILAGVPDAVFAVSAQGRIVVSTPSVNSLLGMRKGSIVGAETSIFRQADTVWVKELISVVSWALVHEQQILAEGVHRVVTEAEKGVRLEISMRAWVPRNHAASNTGVPVSEKTFAFYLRVVPDQRTVQESLLAPTSFERIGAASGEIFLGLAENIRTAGEQLSMLSAKFHNGLDANGRPLPAGPAGAELSQLLVETDKVVRRLSTSFDEQSQRLMGFEEGCEEVAIDHFLPRLFGYLHTSLGLDKRIPITVLGEPLPPGPLGPTRLHACHLPMGESAGLGQYLMWFIRCLLPRARDMRVSIEQEQIGTGTASLVAGAAPGRYVRMTFENSGQSIPPHVMSAQQDMTTLSQAPASDPLTAALFLLTRQVRRLGGFITVTSSPAKGTSVSVYLSNDGKPSKKLGKRDIKRLTGTYLRSQSKSPTQVLIVGEETNEQLGAVRTLLERCSLEPVYRSARELFGELSTPVEFDGRGFSDSSFSLKATDGETDTGEERRPRFDASPLRLLIFDCDQANYAALSLLDELEKEVPRIVKIVLLEQKDSGQLQPLPHWIVLRKPVNEKELEERIRQALRNTASIQESVVVIEGNDPLTGSGLN